MILRSIATKPVAALVLALLLSACSPLAPPEQAQLPTQSAAPTATLRPTSTTLPTQAATPTRTPAPTPLPSATSLPTPLPTVAPTVVPTPTFVPLALAQREQVFDQVWTLVQQRYLYPDYRGVDWQAVRATYAPQVRAAETTDAFYQLMRAMIDQLGDDHSRFDTPRDVAEEDLRAEGAWTYGGIGVSVREDSSGGLITQLAPNGPAEQAGLRPRDLIIAVGGVAFTDTLAFGAAGPNGAIRGAPGSVVQLTVRSPGATPREVQVLRQIIPDDAFPPVSAQRLPGTQIGLVEINTFDRQNLDQLLREQLEQLSSAGPLDGLILDLRENSGGFVDAMLDSIALFVDGGSIGATSGRHSREKLEVPSGRVLPAFQNVPIVILTSAETVSAAEMFAAGMRVRERARVVGETSAGNTENLLRHSLPDGSRLWLAEFAYSLPDGSMLEGSGVQPDRAVAAEWWRYAPADDPQIKAAIEELKQQ